MPKGNKDKMVQGGSTPREVKEHQTPIHNGADQNYLNEGWTIVKVHKERLSLKGVDGPSALRALVNGVRTVLDTRGKLLAVLRVNQAEYRKDLKESLISESQMLWHMVDVDSKAHVHGGSQRLQIGTFVIPLRYNRSTVSMVNQAPTREGLQLLKVRKIPSITLTGSDSYNPDLFWNVKKRQKVHMCSLRLRKLPNFEWNPAILKCWNERFCGIPENLVKKTLRHTTQLVPSVPHENALYPLRSFIKRFPALKVRRLQEHVWTDTLYWTYCGSQQPHDCQSHGMRVPGDRLPLE